MSARSRVSAPANRVYSSSPTERQITFKPRRQRITARESLGSSKLSRQQTLTQIEFVDLKLSPDAYDKDVDIFEDEQRQRRKRRRVTQGDATSTHYDTQTLTQFEYVSCTPASGTVHDENGQVDLEEYSAQNLPPPGRKTRSQSPMLRNADPFKRGSSPIHMRPPETPSKRVLEIPSSQSPATPFSLGSRTSFRRTPLTEISKNGAFSPQVSPSKNKGKPIKLEIEDTFDYEDDTQESNKISSFVTKLSSPSKTVAFAKTATIIPSDGGREDRLGTTSSNPRDVSPTIIQDSEAESDDEPETCYDDLGADTQYRAFDVVSSLEKEGEDERVSISRKSLGILPPSEPTIQSIKHDVRAADADLDAAPEVPEVHQESQSQRLSTQQISSMAPRSDRSDIFISVHPQHVANILSRKKNHEFRSYSLPPHVTRLWIYTTRPLSAIRYMATIGPPMRPGEIIDETGLGNIDFNAGKGTSRYGYEILQLYELANPLGLAKLKENNWLEGPPQKYVYVRPAVLNHLLANLTRPLFSTESQASSEVGIISDSQEAAAQLQSNIVQFSDTPPPVPYQDNMTSPIGSSETKFNEALDLLSTQQDSYRETIRQTRSEYKVRSSQATTVDLTQPPTQDPTHHATWTSRSSMEELKEVASNEEEDLETEDDDDDENYAKIGDDTIVPDSPADHSSSSVSMSLPPLPPQRPLTRLDDMPVPFSLASSQLLTRSQLYSESAQESMPLPPSFIEDSDEEDEI